MTDADIQILKASANNAMRVNRIAAVTHYDRRTVANRLTSIRLRTGLDPRDFWGLQKLLTIVNQGE